MKGIILLNGEPYNGSIDTKNALVYCCDGAYNWAKNKVRIDKNVGDFDSVTELPYPAPEEIYPSEKNFTDGEIALMQLMEKGVDEIEIYGGGGGREDHFLGNLHLLHRAADNGVKCVMFTAESEIYAVRGKIELDKFYGKTLSVLPFGGAAHIMEYRGLKYDYPEKLVYGSGRGISNAVTGVNAYIVIDGCALVIINRGSV